MTNKKKLAIIGASYLQLPLINKAKSMGIETHVFAWAANDVGEEAADFFYPISIAEKELILEKCRDIGIDGIVSIASDLAVCTVNYVAAEMNLIGNTNESTLKSTNKHVMRQAFKECGDPAPLSMLITDANDIDISDFKFPIIVKPVDRSGSRGITRLNSEDGLCKAVEKAIDQCFIKSALIEEYVTGKEYSVEHISWKGKHYFLALTQKYTTGDPNYIETGHIEPACVSDDLLNKIKAVIDHALDTLGIEYGASHSEIKVSEDGSINIIEIGGRMGGDFIGSNLVELSTGFDFVKGVIDISLGNPPDMSYCDSKCSAGVRFIFNQTDIDILNDLIDSNSPYLIDYSIQGSLEEKVTDSSSRHGYFILSADSPDKIKKYFDDLHD